MRFKISVNFIGEFRVAEVIATPLVGIFKKNVIFGEFKGNNPTHTGTNGAKLVLRRCALLKIFLDRPIHLINIGQKFRYREMLPVCDTKVCQIDCYFSVSTVINAYIIYLCIKMSLNLILGNQCLEIKII